MIDFTAKHRHLHKLEFLITTRPGFLFHDAGTSRLACCTCRARPGSKLFNITPAILLAFCFRLHLSLHCTLSPLFLEYLTIMSSRGITPPAQDDQNTFNPTGRLRKPPPVTPKRFSKFFTPRSSAGCVSKPTVTRAGRQLRDITHQSSLNSRVAPPRQHRTSNKKSVAFQDLNVNSKALQTPTSSSRKRKSYATPESSPPQQSSPCKRIRSDNVIPSSPPAYLEEQPGYERSITPEPREPPPRIRRSQKGSAASRMLERSFGGAEYITRGRRRDNCIRSLSLSVLD